MAKLQDLYRRGKEHTITDEDGNKAVFYLKKLNPIESKTALEKANASRARTLLQKRDSESDVYVNIAAELSELNEEELAASAAAPVLASKLRAMEAEVASRDEWAEEDYLTVLKDSWEETYKEIYARTRGTTTDTDYSEEQVAEAERILAELERFDQQIQEEIDKETKRLIRDNKRLSREELEAKCIEDAFDRRGNAAWVETFYQYQVYFATVDKKDKKTRLFESIDEVRSLAPEVYLELLAGYRGLEVDSTEGK